MTMNEWMNEWMVYLSFKLTKVNIKVIRHNYSKNVNDKILKVSVVVCLFASRLFIRALLV